MVAVTDLMLARMLFGGPDRTSADGSRPTAGDNLSDFGPFRPGAEPDADRAALIDALMSRHSSEPYESLPVSMRPTIGGDPNVLNQWGGPRPREYDLYDPPPVRPLPFREQYRREVPADATGRLTHDMEGRPLIAQYVAGLREVDGANVSLRPEEITDAIRRLTGGEIGRSPRSRLGSSYGLTTRDPISVKIRDDLNPNLARKVEAHELSHVIDLIAEFIPVDPHREHLRSIYNTLNNPQRTRDGRDAAGGAPFVPYQRSTSYAGVMADRELMAEAIRAYLVNPNYIKTVAPGLAAAIRDAVNSNPRLAPIIQFNSLRFPTYAGLEQAPGQGQSDIT